jgi:hypothetical protein
LFPRIVKEEVSKQIAGKRPDVMPFEPGTLARSGETDSQYDDALGSSRRRLEACGWLS